MPVTAGSRPRRYRFRPALIPTLAMLVIVVATMSLGNWQTRRAGEKVALQERLDRWATGPAATLPVTPVEAAQWAQRRVTVRGEFIPSGLILIDNRLHKGAPGYHVVMPLRMEGGQMHVLVNRGWVAAGTRRDLLPDIPTLAGTLQIEGVVSVPAPRPYELSKAAEADSQSGPLRQNLVIGRIAADQRLALQPLVILQTSSATDGLVRDWPRPDSRADTNRGYALQWYAMALVAVILWIAFNLKRTDVAKP